MYKILVISLQLVNDRSDFIRKTIVANNLGNITCKEIKFHHGEQKGLENFVAQQKPDYIILDDTGNRSRKLMNKVKQFAGKAKFVHVGYHNIVGIGELHRQFENWKFKLEDLEQAVKAKEPVTEPAALEAVA